MRTILPSLLHVEDDSNDRLFLQQAFRKTELSLQLQEARDGQVAIAYLSGTDAFADRSCYPLPSLVLLDLKMPRKNGFEVLEWIRSQPVFQCLPVVIFTSSKDEADIINSYQKGANSYLLKPVDFDVLVETAKNIYHYWFCLNQTCRPD